MKFAALEDLVIHKVIAGRARDVEDIKSILIKNPRYNKKYVVERLWEFDRSLNGEFQKLFQSIIREI